MDAADATEAGHTESNYDARTARKPNKRQQKTEEFQEKLLQAIATPPPVPAEAPEQDYIDLAFAAIIKKMKTCLNPTEIMDAVEEVEQLVNRICRDKRRRREYQPSTTTTTNGGANIFEQLQVMRQPQPQLGLGPTGPSAVPVTYPDDQFSQHIQF